MTRVQRLACRKAKVIRYVTKYDLQQKYPASRKAIQFSFSDVQIRDIGRARTSVKSKNKVDLVTVGSLDPLYKGIDTLIMAVRDLNLNGFKCHLHVIGDGLQKHRYQALANEIIPNCCTFHGQLNGSEEVIKEINKYDIFVLASKSEGLPRAMLEAMSVGLPCVGTDILGVRELLYPPLKAEASDPKALANCIGKLWNSDTFCSASKHSLKIAQDYLISAREIRFKDFLWHVKNLD
jgi:glycosyltransferase involved in cell wall biosynthesis